MRNNSYLHKMQISVGIPSSYSLLNRSDMVSEPEAHGPCSFFAFRNCLFPWQQHTVCSLYVCYPHLLMYVYVCVCSQDRQMDFISRWISWRTEVCKRGDDVERAECRPAWLSHWQSRQLQEAKQMVPSAAWYLGKQCDPTPWEKCKDTPYKLTTHTFQWNYDPGIIVLLLSFCGPSCDLEIIHQPFGCWPIQNVALSYRRGSMYTSAAQQPLPANNPVTQWAGLLPLPEVSVSVCVHKLCSRDSQFAGAREPAFSFKLATV